ncbi:TSNAX [Cordylochernes scorpioides]|uniref:TSNAX n=1 Tax=Cordylochernes scorpioides TaxID=51811 RepID=A0ABY6LB93_9ARAC|nr:TSNAX [Cordylochernes scorpioides]
MDQRKHYSGNRGRGSRHAKPKFNQRPKADQTTIEASPFAEQFLAYQKELDDKNDRYERLVQKSRDLTIESKRTIFQLHRITGEESKADILGQVRKRLDEVRHGSLLAIAAEVKDCDYYLYVKAFSPDTICTTLGIQMMLILGYPGSPKGRLKECGHAVAAGLQEFVEAVTYYYYLKENRLATWEEIQLEGNFDSQEPSRNLEITQRDYILGVADLTGEVMRKCINAVGEGDLEQPFIVCQFLRAVHAAFQQVIAIGGREIFRKMVTLFSSLSKVERACYSLKIRGSEIPKNHLTDLFETANELCYDSDRTE